MMVNKESSKKLPGSRLQPGLAPTSDRLFLWSCPTPPKQFHQNIFKKILDQQINFKEQLALDATQDCH